MRGKKRIKKLVKSRVWFNSTHTALDITFKKGTFFVIADPISTQILYISMYFNRKIFLTVEYEKCGSSPLHRLLIQFLKGIVM
jgi:hypothetical protein